MDRWVGGWLDAWMDGWMDESLGLNYLSWGKDKCSY